MQMNRYRVGSRLLPLGLAGACALGILVAVSVAGADEAAAPPKVDLDRLLQLPTSLELEPAARGSANKAEWRERFDTARSELADARRALAKTQQDLSEVAGNSSAWQLAAPGMGGMDPGKGVRDNPLDYDLSAQLRRNREEVARAERRLTELDIEANLANVPPDWRGSDVSDEAAASQPLVE